MKTTKELEDAVRRYQNGNTDSFERIYELSYRYLRACVIHVVKDEEIAADMLQETYLEISRSISQLKNAGDFLSWASTIGNRKCYAYLKKQRDVLLRSDEDQNGDAQDFFEAIADDEAFIPETILQDREKRRLVQEIIEGLSDMQRLCIIGFYYRGQSIEEIAQELEIPANTVKSHLSRAKGKIKDAVIVLDREKGTRLYSLAPFMLLFLSMEADACEAGPMPEVLKKELSGSGVKSPGVKNPGVKNSVIKKILRSGVRYKLAAGAVLATVVIGGGAALIHYANSRNAGEENLSETGLAGAVADAGSDTAADTGAEPEDHESAVQTEADENLQTDTAGESGPEEQETDEDAEPEEQETAPDAESGEQETAPDAEPEEQETDPDAEPGGQETTSDAETGEQEDGEGVKEARYNADGTLDCILEYDANGNLVKRYVYYDDGTLDCIYEYGANGKLVKQSYYYSDETIDFYYIWEYDANGKLVKQSGYYADGTLCSYYIWEYDANGNCVKYTDYNADGTIGLYCIYEYDENGNCVKRIDYNADGTLTSYYIFEYDANGNLVKRTDYSADGTSNVIYF